MSPTGPRYPTSVPSYGSGTSIWTNPTNIEAADGAVADFPFYQSNVINNFTADLVSAGHGFNIPSSAIIDGIVAEVSTVLATNSAYNTVRLCKAGVAVGSNYSTSGTGALPTVFGSATDLWGTAWSPSDINNANFGLDLAYYATHSPADAHVQVDYVRITVYWHTAPAVVPKRYIYKVFNSMGAYLGNLPNVISEFTFSEDINTAGTQLSIECGISADTSWQVASTYTDESGTPYTDETGSLNYTNSGVLPAVSIGTSGYDALIKNGNEIIVYEYGYYYPNGICMFRGQMQHWDADFGGDGGSDTIKILAYSDGQDLDNYIARGAPFTYTNDQVQTSQNASETVQTTRGTYNKSGQTFTVGAGVTNISAITLMLNGTAAVTIRLWDSPSLGTQYAVVVQNVSVGSPTAVQFAFSAPVTVTPGTQYFMSVETADGQIISVYYQNTDVYAGGSHYNASYGGGGGGAFGIASGDLYFITASGLGTTTGTYTNKDPTIGMLEPVMNDYIARGGVITYNSNSVDATGLSLTYQLNTNTIYEALKAVMDMCPNGFYYRVDIGTNVLYAKRASATPDFYVTKGRHIKNINLKSSIENVKNQTYFSGGVVSGNNIYKFYQDPVSSAAYGIKLDRKSDNRVTDPTTAATIAQGTTQKQSSEQYQTEVVILGAFADITQYVPGKVLGFNGFGTFTDNLQSQIVRREYHPEYVKLQLGLLPKRLNPEFEKITRGLVAQQTIANPSAPS